MTTAVDRNDIRLRQQHVLPGGHAGQQSLYFDALAGVDPDQPATDDHPVRTGGGLVMRDVRGGGRGGPPAVRPDHGPDRRSALRCERAVSVSRIT